MFLRLMLLATAAWGAGCATPHTVFAISGPTSSVALGSAGQVDERFDAELIDVTLIDSPAYEAKMVPDLRRQMTERLGQMLPAPAGAARAPATTLVIRALGDTRQRIYALTFQTPVAGEVVTTSGTSPDLRDATIETVSAAAGLCAGPTYVVLLGVALLAGIPFGPPGLIIGTGVVLATFLGLLGASYLVGSWAEANATKQSAVFLGALLEQHARNVAAAVRRRSEPALPATAPPPLPGVEGPAWWYVGDGGAPTGPLSAAAVQALQAAGTITGDTLVWKRGMAWTPLKQVPSLKPAAAPPSTTPRQDPSRPPPLPTAPRQPPPLPQRGS